MTTRLINRGEQIFHKSELGEFEAECAWTRTDDDSPTYPIILFVLSIRYPTEYPEPRRRRTVPKATKRSVADRMKQELETDDAETKVRLVDR